MTKLVGLRVFGTMRNPPALAQAPFPMIPLDVTSDQSAAACVQQVVEQAGAIDVIINCCNDMTLGGVQETSMSEMAAMFDINVLGAMRMCKAVLGQMRAQGHGTIINMSSLGGLLAVPYLSGYVATKFALEAFSEALYHELRGEDIEVVIMQPVAMAMQRPDTGTHLKLAAQMTSTSPAHAMAARMAADTRASELTPLQVAAAIHQVILKPAKPLRVPLDRARTLGLLKRFAPQALIDKLVAKLLGNVQPAITRSL